MNQFNSPCSDFIRTDMSKRNFGLNKGKKNIRITTTSELHGQISNHLLIVIGIEFQCGIFRNVAFVWTLQ